MILVFGGTTEGRKAIKELEEAGKPFFYSTKTGEQDVTLHHSIVGGHGHCQLPESQFPIVESFIDRFLLGKAKSQ